MDGAGNVFVADYNNHRIQKFTSTGAFLAKWGSRGTGDGQLQRPRGAAVDGAGNLYVADTANNRIQAFTSSGAFLARWSNEGSDDWQFDQPVAVAVDSSGNVYVANTVNHRIQTFAVTLPKSMPTPTPTVLCSDGMAPVSACVKQEALDGYSADEFTLALDPICENVEPCGSGCVSKTFCIDKYEAFNDGGKAGSAPGKQPWGYINWNDAKVACEAAGKRLCKDFEWMAACNLDGERYYLTEEEYGEEYGCNTYCKERDDCIFETGSHAKCKSDAGVYDMIGNVCEWTDALVPEDSWAVKSGTVGSHLGENEAKYGDDAVYHDPPYTKKGNAFSHGGASSTGTVYSPDHGCFFLDLDYGPSSTEQVRGFRCCAGPGDVSPVPTPAPTPLSPSGSMEIGSSCTLNAECDTGACTNGVCCAVGKVCCKKDDQCVEGELCRATGDCKPLYDVIKVYPPNGTAVTPDTTIFVTGDIGGPPREAVACYTASLEPGRTYTLAWSFPSGLGITTDNSSISRLKGPNDAVIHLDWQPAGDDEFTADFTVLEAGEWELVMNAQGNGVLYQYLLSATAVQVTPEPTRQSVVQETTPEPIPTATPEPTSTQSPTPTRIPSASAVSWGGWGYGDGQLVSPLCVAVDGAGNVYVTDTSNNRIQKFTPDGTFMAKWGSEGAGDGQFNSPEGIAVDGAGNVYVADESNHRIQKFTPDGTFMTKWGSEGTGDGQFRLPTGVTVDGAGNVYVADLKNHRIQKFTSTGTFLGWWGKDDAGGSGWHGPNSGKTGAKGDGDGQFYQPRHVVVDGAGNIYVAERNNRIQKFSPDIVFITKWGSEGNGDGQFNMPLGIAVDGSDNVYVADSSNYRIQKFTSNGVFLTKWGTPDRNDGLFRSPFGVAVDDSGNLYVVDTNRHRIQKFTTSMLTTTPTLESSLKENGYVCTSDVQCISKNCDKGYCCPVNQTWSSEQRICVVEETEAFKTINIILVFIFVFLISAIYASLFKKSTTEEVPRLREKKRPTAPIKTSKPQTTPVPMPIPTPHTIKKVVDVKRGYDRAGEWIKLGIKVTNNTDLVIHKVTVLIDEYPSALQYEVSNKNPMINLQTINPGELQSAIFRFKPTRCVDGSITGFIRYTDAKGKKHTLDIEPIEVKSVCPMLTSDGVDYADVVERLMQESLTCNKVFIEFEGNVRSVFDVVQARLGRLILYDHDWRASESAYIGHLFYLGKTKYAKKYFAAEFLLSGTAEDKGGLTISVYSDEPAILTGFFHEIVSDLENHITVLKESSEVCGIGCGKCGGPLDIEKAVDGGYVKCDHCDFWNRIPKWKR